ncbi:Metallo-dependent hydrolase [Parathielavia appendiculata]|uniref:Metallo-dependent hydrolase n=1 Tax=Parathielavia appendiculata TaxID=2587402 RepID=A0AAN6U172_9PEZI|nr:Metallo-dependent hydrolase [Parathielavia appendiculata]
MTTLKDTATTLMFHAEMVPPITASVGDAVQQSEPPLRPSGELDSYSTFLDSRPPAFETYAVEEILSMANLAPKLHLHIVHLSATECIPLLRNARRSGVNITAETCFHYLGLASDDIPDGDTRHKCCPPIRSQTNQDRLWDEIANPDGCIKTIVSDHSPCTPELKLLPPHLQTVYREGPRPGMHHFDSGIDVTMPKKEEEQLLQLQKKNATTEEDAVDLINPDAASPALPPFRKEQGDFFAAWGGISSVGLGLPILHTTASQRAARGDAAPSIVDIVRMCCQATAKQVGLAHRKGGLRVGMDADICVFDDDDVWTLRAAEMRWKNRCSPWEGHTFRGRVHETWVRGQRVFQIGGENAGFVGGKPIGQPIVERRTA